MARGCGFEPQLTVQSTPAAIHALEVASLGPGESVQACSQHHAAMQRLEGRERHTDTHRPVAVGGGLRPPQDRAAPPGSTRVAHMGLPLLRAQAVKLYLDACHYVHTHAIATIA